MPVPNAAEPSPVVDGDGQLYEVVFTTSTYASSPEEAARIAVAQFEIGSPSVEVFESGEETPVLEYDQVSQVDSGPKP